MHNGLIFYYDIPSTSRVWQIMLRVVHIKFRQVVMSECHIYILAAQIHEKIALFMILEQFWWTMLIGRWNSS